MRKINNNLLYFEKGMKFGFLYGRNNVGILDKWCELGPEPSN